jgi:hypothetical protein
MRDGRNGSALPEIKPRFTGTLNTCLDGINVCYGTIQSSDGRDSPKIWRIIMNVMLQIVLEGLELARILWQNLSNGTKRM